MAAGAMRTNGATSRRNGKNKKVVAQKIYRLVVWRGKSPECVKKAILQLW